MIAENNKGLDISFRNVIPSGDFILTPFKCCFIPYYEDDVTFTRLTNDMLKIRGLTTIIIFVPLDLKHVSERIIAEFVDEIYYPDGVASVYIGFDTRNNFMKYKLRNT